MNEPEVRSLAEQIADLDDAARARLLADTAEADWQALLRDWRFWARPAQLPPEGDWQTWLILAGRGFGKTRTGAEWVTALAAAQPGVHIALVGATAHDARAVMVEGASGLRAVAPPDLRPQVLASRRRVDWPNGSRATWFTAEEPDQLRGPEHHFAWCDEIAKWRFADASWDMLQMGLRLGNRPQVLATTTPRPIALLRRLLADAATTVTRGRTFDNATNLPPGFLAAVRAQYAGTRLGRQELDGELIDDVSGALWTRAMLDQARVRAAPDLERVVVAVDPPVSTGESADACGIVVAGRCTTGHAYVLADCSLQGASPHGWAKAALNAQSSFGADRIVAEVNNGGALVESLFRSLDTTVPFRAVRASHGKVARAEPVAALYERGLVHHVGAFPALEDELCSLVPGAPYAGPGRSPDRADALVWALTELMLRKAAIPGIRNLTR